MVPFFTGVAGVSKTHLRDREVILVGEIAFVNAPGAIIYITVAVMFTSTRPGAMTSTSHLCLGSILNTSPV